MSANPGLADRFFRSLYSLLLDLSICSVANLDAFFALFFRAVKNDRNTDRNCAFLKRLMQVALGAEPHFVCAALLVVSEVLKARADVKLSLALFERESDDEPEEEEAPETPAGPKKQLPRKKRKKLAQKEEAERQKVQEEKEKQ